MTVDVQATWLAVSVFAWAPSGDHKGYAAYLVDYWRIDGDCENADAAVWEELAEVIDNRSYRDGDREYPITMSLIDASYLPDTVYSFCAQWDAGVYPLRGRDKPTKGARFQEFEIKENATGTRYVLATVDIYKDRWSAALKRDWNGHRAHAAQQLVGTYRPARQSAQGIDRGVQAREARPAKRQTARYLLAPPRQCSPRTLGPTSL